MQSLADFVADIHAGKADPGEGVAQAEAAIRNLNPNLNAVVDHCPDAASGQVEVLRSRLRLGERPPLAGIPITVKDQFHVAGWPVTEGSLLLRNRVATADEPVVARLRAAGAILVGRTNMSEFGCKGVTDNRLYGPTRHHLDLDLTPGGSSGGAAVAVATGMCAIALAGDGGGSVRRPAAHVGVAGFKPSTGAIPTARGLSHTAVPGLMARDVVDIAHVFAVLRGACRGDPVSVEFGRGTLPDPRTIRFGWAPTLGLSIAVDDAAAEAAEAALVQIAASGYRIGPAQPVWPDGAMEARLMPLQYAALAARWGDAWHRDPTVFDPDISVQIEAGLSLSGVEVAHADALSHAVARAAAAFFEDGPDLLLALTAPCTAWPLGRLGPERIGGAPAGQRDHAALTPLINHSFLPAVSIPCGSDDRGLPFGLQVIGPRFSDDLVLCAAAAIATVLAA